MERIFKEFDSIKQQKLQRKVQYHSFPLKRTQVDAHIAAETGLKEGRALLKCGINQFSFPQKIPHFLPWHFLWLISGKYRKEEMWTEMMMTILWKTEKCRDLTTVFWVIHIDTKPTGFFCSNANSSEHCSPAVSAWINEVSPPGITISSSSLWQTSAMANNLEWLATKLNTPLRKKQTFLLIARKIKGTFQTNDCACQIWFNIFNVITMLSGWKGKQELSSRAGADVCMGSLNQGEQNLPILSLFAKCPRGSVFFPLCWVNHGM